MLLRPWGAVGGVRNAQHTAPSKPTCTRWVTSPSDLDGRVPAPTPGPRYGLRAGKWPDPAPRTTRGCPQSLQSGRRPPGTQILHPAGTPVRVPESTVRTISRRKPQPTGDLAAARLPARATGLSNAGIIAQAYPAPMSLASSLPQRDGTTDPRVGATMGSYIHT